MTAPLAQTKSTPAQASALAAARSSWQVSLLAALLAVVTLFIYWPATSHNFVNYDDQIYVTGNVRVQAGLSLENLKWAFLTPLGANWHPLTILSHMLDCHIYGLKPWGHHLTSVLLHAANTVLVFLLLRGLTGEIWRSLMVAALFGWHPVHVESVAWVAERKDVLSGFFGVLTLIFYASYVRKSQDGRQRPAPRGPSPGARGRSRRFHLPPSIFYLLSLFCLALGLMSKPMLVTWPFVMLLLDYWPLERFPTSNFQFPTFWRLVREKLPFFALVILFSAATFLVQESAGAVATFESTPLELRFENALISYCRYLGKIFWPADLAVYYPYPAHWPVAVVVLAGGLLAGLSLFFWRRRQWPFLLMGWLWFMGTLVPVIGLVQVGSQALADRYTYLPSLGVYLLIVWGASELTRGWRYQVLGLSAAGAVAISFCLPLTWHQLEYWQDDEALFRHALLVTGQNYVANNGLGYALLHNNQIDEAISQFQIALHLQPNYAAAHFNLGAALGKKGQTDDEMTEFKEALRLEPDSALNHYNLGLVLRQKGRMEEAINEYREALRLNRDYVDAHNNLGYALLQTGQIAEAISQFQESLRLRPNYFEAHNNLGIALFNEGRLDEAISEFEEVVRLNRDYAPGQDNLAKALNLKNTPPSR